MPVQNLACFAPNVIEDDVDFELDDEQREGSGDSEEQTIRRLVIDEDDSDDGIEVLNESIEIDVVEKVCLILDFSYVFLG